jgi:hypothetical protein
MNQPALALFRCRSGRQHSEDIYEQMLNDLHFLTHQVASTND